MKQLEYSFEDRLKEEDSKDRLEHASWQQSLVMRKRVGSCWNDLKKFNPFHLFMLDHALFE